MGSPYTNAFLDGISTTTKGMNSGASPRLLPPDQLAFLCNATSRGGYPHTRPAIRKVPLSYATGIQINATQGNFQCAHFYESYSSGENCLVASIGGRLFRYLVGSSNAVSEISISGDLNDPTRLQAWMWQGEDFLFTNDGLGYPLIFDGATVKRSLGPPGQQLPTGTVGHYCNGRIVMALPNRRAFIAGDLVYSKGGSGPFNGRDAILGITENISILGGAAFSVPVSAGPINSMASIAIPDTSLGQGPLQIGTRKGVYSINLPLDATTWTSLQFPSSVVSLPSSGPLSQNGVVNVNGDLWYRARDGFRSFSVARRDFNTWVQTPLSDEVEKIINRDTKALLNSGSGVLFNNRFLHTCSPYRIDGRGTAFRGLIALDFNNISNLITRTDPCYDGLWTGLPILQILTGTFDDVDRCFIFALDCSNNICLYELRLDESYRSDYDGSDDVPIESYLHTGALFGRESQESKIRLPLKKLIVADLFLDKASGNVEFETHYRSDQHPLWRSWHNFSLCKSSEVCSSTEACPTFQNVLDQFAGFIRLPEPNDDCSSMTGRSYRTGYEFQMRLQWTGYAELNRTMVWATPISEIIPVCPGTGECSVVTGCEENYFTYQIETECPGVTIPPTPTPPPDPPDPEQPPPPWPEQPEEPNVWPLVPPPPPLTVDPTWPPIPPDEDPDWTPPTYIPDLGCGAAQQNVNKWYVDGVAVRYPSSGNEADNPNEIFDAALIRWWKSHLESDFLAYMSNAGLPVSLFRFYWSWESTGESLSVLALFQSDGRQPYEQAGWELQIAYCP